ALQTKRMRAVARAWPSLARSLGKRYPQQFAAFASQTPLPQGGSFLDDGWAFARWLDQAGELAEPGRLELLAIDLRHAVQGGCLVPRRGFAVAMAVLSHPRRLVLALRLPWVGERWWTLPWGAESAVGGYLQKKPAP